MSILQGLGTFEMLKTGGIIIILILCMCCSLGMAIYTNVNYVSTTNCNIVLNSDQSETLTYVVNNKTYIESIQPIEIQSAPSSAPSSVQTRPFYPVGGCKLYYNEKDPTKYEVNSSPGNFAIFFLGLSGIACCLITFMSIYLVFLRANPEAAGIAGGVGLIKDMKYVF
jgi:hypothetical protein